MLIPVFLIILPLLVCDVFVHPFSKTFIAGIDSAREPSHRLTLQSPWYFFDLYYDAVAKRARNRYVPCFVIVCFVAFAWQAFTSTTLWVAFLTTEAVAFMLVATTGAAIYIVIHYAPRFENPNALTMVSLLFGMVLTFSLYLVGVGCLMGLGYLIYGSTDTLLLQGVLAIPPLLAGLFTLKCLSDWKRIRSSSTHEWFRFES